MWIVDKGKNPSNIFPNREDAIAFVCAEMRACGISETEISRWRWRARNVRNTAHLPFDAGRLVGIIRIARAVPIEKWNRVLNAILENPEVMYDMAIRVLVLDPDRQGVVRAEPLDSAIRGTVNPIGLIRCLG